MDLYHRTTEEAARAILASGRFLTRENTPEAFASTHFDSEAAAGYGDAVVHVRVDDVDAQLDDEFPDGEQHYRIPLDRAEIIDAFTIAEDGTRVPLAGAVTDAREASFPTPPQTRTVTANAARPAAAQPNRGPQLSR
ncbi:hypothetical protein EXU48_23925 [Occultella glacieicola]|uniref:Uncharacterized protein n=1 Tax=Occultella glacieicola TaxID=2518684 RepID=A0ABY2DWK4_9MICO|nr:hypothetical protein [Occultella glacieicola]TDE88172.1 hypothetical protein EXU48_23925 [Occultella glacieicola]